MKIPFFSELEGAQSILIVGAGGGFDVFCGLPLYFWLKKAGKSVHLANLSSGALGFCDAENPVSALWRITPKTAATKYSPEMHLSAWLTERFGETPVFAIAPSGARPVSAAYEWLARTLKPDAIVLVDGGTDSLMRGDEAGLATPEGDAGAFWLLMRFRAYLISCSSASGLASMRITASATRISLKTWRRCRGMTPISALGAWLTIQMNSDFIGMPANSPLHDCRGNRAS